MDKNIEFWVDRARGWAGTHIAPLYVGDTRQLDEFNRSMDALLAQAATISNQEATISALRQALAEQATNVNAREIISGEFIAFAGQVWIPTAKHEAVLADKIEMIRKQGERIEKMREALEWYADDFNYSVGACLGPDGNFDEGRIAAEALRDDNAA